MDELKSDDVLQGISEIKAYVGLSEPSLRKLLALGMPAFLIDNRWYSSKTAINKFFFIKAMQAGRKRARR